MLFPPFFLAGLYKEQSHSEKITVSQPVLLWAIFAFVNKILSKKMRFQGKECLKLVLQVVQVPQEISIAHSNLLEV